MSEAIQIKDRTQPASYKQVAYLGRLMTEEAMDRGLTKGEASDLIQLIQDGDWYADHIGTAIKAAIDYTKKES